MEENKKKGLLPLKKKKKTLEIYIVMQPSSLLSKA
jgi:hypothetical protein